MVKSKKKIQSCVDKLAVIVNDILIIKFCERNDLLIVCVCQIASQRPRHEEIT